MKPSLSEQVIAFEAGTLSKEGIYALFDELLSSGELWVLPTDYLDRAAVLLGSKLIGPERADRQKERLRGMHS